jgi:hypothetical protein
MRTLISFSHFGLYYNPTVCLFGINLHWKTHYGISLHVGPLSFHVSL